MALPYSEPGVQIRELVSPNFGAPPPNTPTSIALVGPSRGFESVTDVISLVDQGKVTLSRQNPDVTTISVFDASDPSATTFTESNVSNGNRDYTLDTSDLAATGVVRISRSMQTRIADGETVVTYFENSGSPATTTSFTRQVTLDRTYNKIADGSAGAVGANGLSSATVSSSLAVQSRGEVPTAEVAISGSGTTSPTLTWQNVGGSQVIRKFQTLYVDYDLGGVTYRDQVIQLNNATPVAVGSGSGVITNIVLKNAPSLGNVSASIPTAALYTKASGSTDSDYVLSGTGVTLTIARSPGSTTMGVTDDQIRVTVTYDATADDYWLPTRVYSPSDAEKKYGAALDPNGNINSPLSFAAGLAFQNGASEMVLQALFHDGNSFKSQPTGAAGDWSSTFAQLRVMDDVNVIVPILGVGGPVLNSNDTLVASIISAAKSHIDFMATLNQAVIVLAGTDSTTAGQGGQAARRALAHTFADERVTVVSPANFAYVNQLNRRLSVGGQYAAAAAAGMLARYPIQQTLTRKTMVGLAAVNEIVNPLEKNKDAGSGLLVLENKNGSVRVRHALTTDNTAIARRELNVVRCKFYMMDLIRETIDQQIIGQITADENAPFTVQVTIGGILETLVSQGVIVTYTGLTAQLSKSNPTQVNARFSYKPAFPLNYVSVEFNIDLSTGTIVTDASATATS